MDIFSSFIGDDDGVDAKPSMSSAPLVTRVGLVVKLHQHSLLFFDDKSETEIFIPYTQIRDFWYTDCMGNLGNRVSDLEQDDEITIVIPEWLARKEGLL